MVSWTKLGHGVFNMIREQDEERVRLKEYYEILHEARPLYQVFSHIC